MIPQSEAIERFDLEDVHRAAAPTDKQALGLRGEVIASAFVSVVARAPASAIAINRTIGLGLGAPATRASVQEILAAYRAAHVSRYLIHVHPRANPPALADWLEAEGLVKARAWQKFSRGREPVKDAPTDLEVREIGPENGAAFARIACAAFDLGAEVAPWIARLPGRAGWHIFMSFSNGEPAGTGALFVRDGLAWFDFGATAPAYRQRGSQAALLAARIKCALDRDCRAMYTCTGVAVPGDPQHSYKNILKAGFREDYVRENYAPPKT